MGETTKRRSTTYIPPHKCGDTTRTRHPRTVRPSERGTKVEATRHADMRASHPAPMARPAECIMCMSTRSTGALSSQSVKIGCPRPSPVPRTTHALRHTTPLLATNTPPAALGLLKWPSGRPPSTRLHVRVNRVASGEAQGCGEGVHLQRQRRDCIAKSPPNRHRTHL